MTSAFLECTPPYTPIGSRKESLEDLKAQVETPSIGIHSGLVLEQETRLNQHTQGKAPVYVDANNLGLASVVAVSRYAFPHSS